MYPKLFIYQIIGYLIIKLIVQQMQAERASSNSNRVAAKCFQRRNWPVRGATYATEAQWQLPLSCVALTVHLIATPHTLLLRLFSSHTSSIFSDKFNDNH